MKYMEFRILYDESEVVILVISKAFNPIWYGDLLYKLLSYRLSPENYF